MMRMLKLKNIILLAVTLAFTLTFSESKAQTVPYWYRVSRLEDAILKTHWEVRGTNQGHPFSYVFEADFNVLFYEDPGGDVFYGGAIRAAVLEFSAIAEEVIRDHEGAIVGSRNFQVTSAKIEIDEGDPYGDPHVGGWMREESEEVIFYFSNLYVNPTREIYQGREVADIYYDYSLAGENIRISKAKLDRRVDFSQTFRFADELYIGPGCITETTVTLTLEFLECECQPEFTSKDFTGGEVTVDGRKEPVAPYIEKLEARLREHAAAMGYKFLSRQDLHRLVKKPDCKKDKSLPPGRYITGGYYDYQEAILGLAGSPPAERQIVVYYGVRVENSITGSAVPARITRADDRLSTEGGKITNLNFVLTVEELTDYYLCCIEGR